MVEYDCPSCGERVEGSPYRASCPECGSRLEGTAHPTEG